VESQRPGLPCTAASSTPSLLHLHTCSTRPARNCSPASSVCSPASTSSSPLSTRRIAVLADGLVRALDRFTPTLPGTHPAGPDLHTASHAPATTRNSLSSHRCTPKPDTIRRNRSRDCCHPERSTPFSPSRHSPSTECILLHPPLGITILRIVRPSGPRSRQTQWTDRHPQLSLIHMTIALNRPSRALQASLFSNLKSRSSTALKTTIL
jgi:hypothetical protein